MQQSTVQGTSHKTPHLQEAWMFNLFNKECPILCDEMIMDTGEIIPLTQRERDIDSILRYFYTNCGQEVLDVHSLTHTVTEQFPSIIIAMYHFLRKCSEG